MTAKVFFEPRLVTLENSYPKYKLIPGIGYLPERGKKNCRDSKGKDEILAYVVSDIT